MKNRGTYKGSVEVRSDSKVILLCLGDIVFRSRSLCKNTHESFVVRVQKTILNKVRYHNKESRRERSGSDGDLLHSIHEFRVTHSSTGARLRDVIRGIGHTLHSTCNSLKKEAQY